MKYPYLTYIPELGVHPIFKGLSGPPFVVDMSVGSPLFDQVDALERWLAGIPPMVAQSPNDSSDTPLAASTSAAASSRGVEGPAAPTNAAARIESPIAIESLRIRS